MRKIFADVSNEITEREIINAQISRKAAADGMVLLSNDGTLPLKKKGKIALFGAGGRKTLIGGTGSGDVNPRYSVSIEEGLENAGFEVTTKNWLSDYTEIYDNAEKEYAQMIYDKAQKSMSIFGQLFTNQFLMPAGRLITDEDIKASDTDTAIYVISRISGEGSDRKLIKGDYYLFEAEEENIRKLTESYEKVIVVLNIGGVIDTKFLRKIGVSAIILMLQAGMQGGNALCDLLLGKMNFSGKLTDTWAENYEDYPSSKTFSRNDGDILEEYYTEGIYVGYRYFDSFNIKPAYPFGFGLSYTDFKTDFICAERKDDKIELSFKVTNIGKEYSGRETVQVYVSSFGDRPYQELKAYGKTKLIKPGEYEEITVSFAIASLAYFSEEKASMIIEKGKYYVRFGNSSRNTHVCACVEVTDEIVAEKLSNSCKTTKEFEELKADPSLFYSYENEELEKKEALVIAVDDIKPFEKAMKPKNENALKILEKLTSDEKIALCIGEYKRALVIAPGEAAETVSGIEGLEPLSLADGPAGLRLLKEFYVSKEGETADFGNPIALPGARFLFPQREKPSDDYTTYYQYCTAIPIGTLLAQTWDKELLTEIGEAVAGEMIKFGVDFWLAPGMNIHRNPLCGRNFEYYSEDPVVSGVCASKITLGVQKNSKSGATIKHFAANSQEEGRMSTNSNISQRALREIYLKGFEIAVKEAKPFAIMTSYNLINGYHTANYYDLLTTILRDEWGFEGFVMTDWGTTGNGIENNDSDRLSYSSLCIKCGNDITMPGSQADFDDINNALNEGKITISDIDKCALRLIEAIIRAKN